MPGAGSSDISRLRQAGNYWLNKIVNVLYGTRYTDLCYGYNAFRRDCLESSISSGIAVPTRTVDMLGGRLRGGDADQRADRQGRPPGVRGPELREQPRLRRQQSQRLQGRVAGAPDDPHRADPRDTEGDAAKGCRASVYGLNRTAPRLSTVDHVRRVKTDEPGNRRCPPSRRVAQRTPVRSHRGAVAAQVHTQPSVPITVRMGVMLTRSESSKCASRPLHRRHLV